MPIHPGSGAKPQTKMDKSSKALRTSHEKISIRESGQQQSKTNSTVTRSYLTRSRTGNPPPTTPSVNEEVESHQRPNQDKDKRNLDSALLPKCQTQSSQYNTVDVSRTDFNKTPEMVTSAANGKENKIRIVGEQALETPSNEKRYLKEKSTVPRSYLTRSRTYDQKPTTPSVNADIESQPNSKQDMGSENLDTGSSRKTALPTNSQAQDPQQRTVDINRTDCEINPESVTLAANDGESKIFVDGGNQIETPSNEMRHLKQKSTVTRSYLTRSRSLNLMPTAHPHPNSEMEDEIPESDPPIKTSKFPSEEIQSLIHPSAEIKDEVVDSLPKFSLHNQKVETRASHLDTSSVNVSSESHQMANGVRPQKFLPTSDSTPNQKMEEGGLGPPEIITPPSSSDVNQKMENVESIVASPPLNAMKIESFDLDSSSVSGLTQNEEPESGFLGPHLLPGSSSSGSQVMESRCLNSNLLSSATTKASDQGMGTGLHSPEGGSPPLNEIKIESFDLDSSSGSGLTQNDEPESGVLNAPLLPSSRFSGSQMVESKLSDQGMETGLHAPELLPICSSTLDEESENRFVSVGSRECSPPAKEMIIDSLDVGSLTSSDLIENEESESGFLDSHLFPDSTFSRNHLRKTRFLNSNLSLSTNTISSDQAMVTGLQSPELFPNCSSTSDEKIENRFIDMKSTSGSPPAKEMIINSFDVGSLSTNGLTQNGELENGFLTPHLLRGSWFSPNQIMESSFLNSNLFSSTDTLPSEPEMEYESDFYQSWLFPTRESTEALDMEIGFPDTDLSEMQPEIENPFLLPVSSPTNSPLSTDSCLNGQPEGTTQPVKRRNDLDESSESRSPKMFCEFSDNVKNLQKKITNMRVDLENRKVPAQQMKLQMGKFLEYLEDHCGSTDMVVLSPLGPEYSNQLNSSGATNVHERNLNSNVATRSTNGPHSDHDYSMFLYIETLENIEDLNLLTVGELEKILILHKINYTGCLGRQDLLERVRHLWKILKSKPGSDALPLDNVHKK